MTKYEYKEDLIKSYTDDDIRVSYIDKDLGLIENVDKCEANTYAKRNPGTYFIYRDAKNNIKYLNINDVNKLNFDDIETESISNCPGVSAITNCDKSPRIVIFGGGGTGAKANPVILDGKLAAVDLIYGGFGYTLPPIVKVVHDCNRGSGAVLKAELGITVEGFQTYENPEDFEIYEICSIDEDNYGEDWGVDGENNGSWDPNSNQNLKSVDEQIEEYQKQFLTLGTGDGFWSSRTTKPTIIEFPSGKKFTNIAYDVDLKYNPGAWSDFMNNYAISPIPPSSVKGSDGAGKTFHITWEVNFELDGDYKIKGSCDNKAELFIDGESKGSLATFNDKYNEFDLSDMQSGPHIISVQLKNTVDLKSQIKRTFRVNDKGAESETISPITIKVDMSSSNNELSIRYFKSGIYKFEIQCENTLSQKMNLGSYNYRGGLDAESFGLIISSFDEIKNPDAKDRIIFNSALDIKQDGSGSIYDNRDYWNNGANTNNGWRSSPPLNGTASASKILKESSVSFNYSTLGSFINYAKYSTVIYQTIIIPQDGKYKVQFAANPSAIFTATHLAPIGGAITYSPPKDTEYLQNDFFSTRANKATRSLYYFAGDTTLVGKRITKSDQAFREEYSVTLWNLRERVMRAQELLETGEQENINTANEILSEQFAGEHEIIWENVDFPITSTCKVKIACDDTCIVTFEKNNSIVLSIEFNEGANSAGSDYERDHIISKGTYTIKVILKQARNNPMIPRNPCDFGMLIKCVKVFSNDNAQQQEWVIDEEEIQVFDIKSWNENPMGVALLLDAPKPTTKKIDTILPPNLDQGQCPPNPLWTTRFPNVSNSLDTHPVWYPVNFPIWGKFMNRYAISPLPPSDTPGPVDLNYSYSQKWKVTIPYSGIYGISGTCDDEASLFIYTEDDSGSAEPYAEFNGGTNSIKLDPFWVPKPTINKIKLVAGGTDIKPIPKTYFIRIAVGNSVSGNTKKTLQKKIFSTNDWTGFTAQTQPITQTIKEKRITSSSRVFHVFNNTDKPVTGGVGQATYATTAAFSDVALTSVGSNPITVHPFGQIPPNRIADYIPAGFGRLSLRAGYNEGDPQGKYNPSGVRGYKCVFPKAYPDITYNDIVIIVTADQTAGDPSTTQIGYKYLASISNLTPNGCDVEFGGTHNNVLGVGFLREWTIAINETVDVSVNSYTSVGGSPNTDVTSGTSSIIYDGINSTKIVTYKPNTISPFILNTTTPTLEIQGKTWYMNWKGLKFTEEGIHTLSVSVFGEVTVYIKNPENSTSILLGTISGVDALNFKVSKDMLFPSWELQLKLTSKNLPNTGFKENPVSIFLEITGNVEVDSGERYSWIKNPVGVSAILIPPPCRKIISGKGTIIDIVPIIPGEQYPTDDLIERDSIIDFKCPPGQILDSNTGKCINLCPPEKQFDEVSQTCVDVPLIVDPQPELPPGIIPNTYDPPPGGGDPPPGFPYTPPGGDPGDGDPGGFPGGGDPPPPGTSGIFVDPPPGFPGTPPGGGPPGGDPGGFPIIEIIPRDSIISRGGSTIICWIITGGIDIISSNIPGVTVDSNMEGCVSVTPTTLPIDTLSDIYDPPPGGGDPNTGTLYTPPGGDPGGGDPGGFPGGGDPRLPGTPGFPGGGPGGGDGSPLTPPRTPDDPGLGDVIEYYITASGEGGTSTKTVSIIIGDPGDPSIIKYPVVLILDDVVPTDPGINYGSGDILEIDPPNGVILKPIFGAFGTVERVDILDNGLPFNVYPTFTIRSDTGVNASFRPVFKIIRDPIDPILTRENNKLIQVTDLVGIKKTGYITGRPYYGSVFYEYGIRYAGFYKTAGILIRVYDTLEESITTEVTTIPSAIEKFGTDNNSNNPRLNIPNTPQNII